jgi:hypothetical protein
MHQIISVPLQLRSMRFSIIEQNLFCSTLSNIEFQMVLHYQTESSVVQQYWLKPCIGFSLMCRTKNDSTGDAGSKSVLQTPFFQSS